LRIDGRITHLVCQFLNDELIGLVAETVSEALHDFSAAVVRAKYCNLGVRLMSKNVTCVD
jgi:hypothetical protein